MQSLREKHSRQRAQQVQRPWGGNDLGIVQGHKEGEGG